MNFGTSIYSLPRQSNIYAFVSSRHDLIDFLLPEGVINASFSKRCYSNAEPMHWVLALDVVHKLQEMVYVHCVVVSSSCTVTCALPP